MKVCLEKGMCVPIPHDLANSDGHGFYGHGFLPNLSSF
jgi:hypothetical protein